LIVGSGIGGIVALLVGLQKKPASTCVDFFLHYSQKIFQKSARRFSFLSQYLYSKSLLEETFQGQFGKTETMDTFCSSESTLVLF
jgi:patatin-like phospholipase/acyl hydrolase